MSSVARIVGLLLVVAVPVCEASEAEVASRIHSVGLFKNGLAFVRRSVTLPGPGVYAIRDVPEPVHGTFWVQSQARIQSRVTMRDVDEPVGRHANLDLAASLAGKSVTIQFSEPGLPSVAGKVLEGAAPRGEDAWSRGYEMPRYGYYDGGSSSYGALGRAGAYPSRFLVVRTDKGISYVDVAKIAVVQAQGAETVCVRKPVLLLAAAGEEKKPIEVEVSYLCKGMAWAPSYRVDLTDPKTLTLEQGAVIKNELADLDQAKVFLISGFPSVQFAHVTSPLSLKHSWAEFFQQLSQQIQPGHASLLNAVSQQVAYNDPSQTRDVDLSAIPTGDGIDLHYQDIGPQSLSEGDSVALSVASGKAEYAKIVEWSVPDLRDENGRPIQDYVRQQAPEKYEDPAWDAIRFKNPLPFPMTTGPATVTAAGRFSGQRLSFWVNAGEEAMLRINKALSVRTRSVERELENSREHVPVGSHTYRKVAIEGELSANNHRAEPVTLVIRRSFSGELVSADKSPKCTLLAEGACSVNKRNELAWTVDLQPGADIRLAYRYSVLVLE